jgi:hypothetical protein
MATTDIRGATVSAADPPISTSPNPDLAIKAPVRVATTGSNITLAGLQTIDGVALSAGDRVLVKDETDATTNGLYNATTGPWTRTIDAANNSQFAQGMQVAVTSGTANAGINYKLTTTSPITLGTSSLTFASQSATIAALLIANNLSDIASATLALANLAGAPLASPVFTSNPTAPTPTTGDNSASIATTAFVQATVNAVALTPVVKGLTINPTANSLNAGLTINQSVLGSSGFPTGNAMNLVYINGDDAALTGPSFIQGFQLTYNIGGSSMQGGRNGIAAFLNLAAPTSASNANRNYLAGWFNAYSAAGDGGTNTGAGALGALFALGSWNDLQSGATNLLGIGNEFDLSVRTGASVKHKTNLALIEHALDGVSGATTDALLVFSAQAGALGMNTLITISDYGTKHPLKSTGTIMATATIGAAATALNGIDLSSGITFTGAAFVGPTYAGGNGAASSLTIESTTGAGTTDKIVLKTASQVIRGTIATGGQWAIGPTAPSANVQFWINAHANSASVDAGPSGTDFQLSGGDGSGGASTFSLFDAFGGNNVINFRRADGSAASRTGLVVNDVIYNLAATGWTSAAAYTANNAATQKVIATETWSGTANGAAFTFSTTPNTTTTLAEAMRIQPSGGLSIGTTTDPGIGSLIVNASLLHPTSANGAVATVLGSVGPTGSHTTVQEWFPIKNSSGTVRYVPGF